MSSPGTDPGHPTLGGAGLEGYAGAGDEAACRACRTVGGGLGSVLKRVLNCPERITYHRLSAVCARRSAEVYAKVRLADVLPVEGSGLPEGLYEFALRAHYDFVITDAAQKPLFAVEFDGPAHNGPAQTERDTKKDELSRRFNLPLLRVVADDLRRSELRLDRLTEVTERWFVERDPSPGNHLVGSEGPAVDPFARGTRVEERPSCPLCGSGMIVKNGNYGPFLSCDRFPNCRGSRDLLGPSSPARPQADGVRKRSSHPIPRQWLIGGIVLVCLALASMAALIARSSIDRPQAGAPPQRFTGSDPATARQMNFLGLLIRRRGWDAVERDAQMQRVLGYDRRYSELSKREASKLITAWDDRGK